MEPTRRMNVTSRYGIAVGMIAILVFTILTSLQLPARRRH
jgi:hypothetical protein